MVATKDPLRGTDMLPARFFKALGEPTRSAMVGWMITQSNREVSVTEVSESFPLDVSVVSRHLAILRDAGILRAERRGRRVFYKVRVGWVARILRRCADAVGSRPGTYGPISEAIPRDSAADRYDPRDSDTAEEAWRSW